MSTLPKPETWRVTYVCGPTTLNFEVEAWTEEEAVMRAGMLRAERLNPRRGLWMGGRDCRQWERVSCVCVG